MCSSNFLCECEYKANSSQQMDYEDRSHDLGNPPRRYYYVKKLLQFVILVINIRVKGRAYSVFKNKVHILMQRDTWYMRGVSYASLTLRNSCSVGYLLPSLETFHSSTTEKTHSPIHGCCHAWARVVRDKTKKRWRDETAVLPSLNKHSRCY
jgi:hypothetical protein